MPLKTLPFDGSEFLDDAESQAELLADAFKTGDPETVKHALGVVARARGMSSIAQEAGIARAELYKALIEYEGDPKFSPLMGIAKMLGAAVEAQKDDNTPQQAAE